MKNITFIRYIGTYYNYYYESSNNVEYEILIKDLKVEEWCDKMRYTDIA